MNVFISLPAAFMADTMCCVSCSSTQRQGAKAAEHAEASLVWLHSTIMVCSAAAAPAASSTSCPPAPPPHLHAGHGKRRLLHVELLLVKLVSLALVQPLLPQHLRHDSGRRAHSGT